jgi:hypothetical protein
MRGNDAVPEPYVSDLLMQALRAGDAQVLADALHNDLQAPAIRLRPSLAQVLEVGKEYGALGGIALFVLLEGMNTLWAIDTRALLGRGQPAWAQRGQA